MAVFQFIEGFYNLSRHHSALGDLSPLERKHDSLTKPVKGLDGCGDNDADWRNRLDNSGTAPS
jgi:hypothetical protein